MTVFSMLDHMIDMHPRLPDGTPLPATAFFACGVVFDQTDRVCTTCHDSGLIDRRGGRCPDCGGTGRDYAPAWRWEE